VVLVTVEAVEALEEVAAEASEEVAIAEDSEIVEEEDLAVEVAVVEVLTECQRMVKT